jgi:hypothetical protein
MNSVVTCHRTHSMPRKTPKRKKIQAAKLAAQPQPRRRQTLSAVENDAAALAILALMSRTFR